MPKSLRQILARADEYAAVFEAYEPKPEDEMDGNAYLALHEAAAARVQAEVRLTKAVAAARAGRVTWSTIGAILGTSGEAARQRYGVPKSAQA
ncbi:MAG: hypothetical protein EPO52_06680 [Herbiconiux sp.]|uniref:hypothetical protein n=1 Tax=Herbiconiux sp. TaxID=1871186 RepID=UPI001220D92B|nr:hypothetical protein [Herbiconiux sp.]TAJ47879.1 MAG: hypothetical protein EPO52_06680 [Herbiconiux sp.]